MINRLRAVSWGGITIGLAYGVAVLPIVTQEKIVWLGLAVALAYLVLAVRTTHATAELAQSSDDQSVFALWWTAFRATLAHRALLLIPMFSLMMVAQAFFVSAPIECSAMFRAYCSYNAVYGISLGLQTEAIIIAVSTLGIFLLLDHGLLIALTLLAHKHLPKSSAFVGNTAVGMRFAMACAVLALVAVSLQVLDVTSYKGVWYENTLTDRRVRETIYPSFEPLVTSGILLSANIINRPSYCQQNDPNSDLCIMNYDTRPYVARQMVSTFMGMLMYSVLIMGVLRLTAPFSLQLSVAHAKTKRGPIQADPEIAYL
jgi:hypothetical protein